MNEILRAYQGDENYVFVSYSHKDKAEVYPIIRAMQENGYNVWFDEGIAPSSEWDEYIAMHTDGANFFIAMVSPEYLASPFCIKELKFACNYLHKKILLIYLEEVELSLGLQLTTTDLQAMKKYEISDTSYFYAKLFSTEALDSCKSQNIRFYSGDTADKTDDAFEIENGVLKKYHGDSDIVVIPDGITRIGDWAFSFHKSLTAIKIPDGVTSIGDFAFYECGALTSIGIPDSVTSIGDSAFQACEALAAIKIPNNVTHIGNKAFKWCQSLKSIHIPNGVTTIGDEAFESCYVFTSIEIPDSVTSIGDRAFGNCNTITSIEIPDSVTSIGDGAFECCKSLKTIHIPESVTSIGDKAFDSCDKFISIEIPQSVTCIGKNAFPLDTMRTISSPIFDFHIADSALILSSYHGNS